MNTVKWSFLLVCGSEDADVGMAFDAICMNNLCRSIRH